jgi:type IV pilus assembly protein PilB
MQVSQKEGMLLHTAIDLAKIAPPSQILDVFASLYGVNKINLEAADISPEIVKLLPKKLAEDFKVIPIDRAGNNLMVAMANPKDVKASEQIRFQTGYYTKCSSKILFIRQNRNGPSQSFSRHCSRRSSRRS